MKKFEKELRKKLQEDSFLRRLQEEKSFLLSEYEKRMLNIYLKDLQLIKYKKEMILSFISRILLLEDDRIEYYKKQLEELNTKTSVKTKIGVIGEIDFTMPTKTTLVREKPKSFGNNAYFNQLVEKEDYDELFNLYDLKIIERDTNIFKKR